MKKYLFTLITLLGMGSALQGQDTQPSIGVQAYFFDGKSVQGPVGSYWYGNQGLDFSHSIGFNLEFPLSNRWSIQGGVALTQYATSSRGQGRFSHGPGSIYIVDGPFPVTVPVLPSGSAGVERRFNWDFYYVDIQVGGVYFFSHSRFRPFLQPYAEANLFLADSQTDELFYRPGNINGGLGFTQIPAVIRKLNFTGGLAIGGEYRLSRQLSIRMAPQAEYMLLRMSDNSFGAGRLLSWGLSAGLSYRM